MKIGICDDDVFTCELLQEELRKYLGDRYLYATFSCFQTAEALLACPDLFDLIFLDYQLDTINGLDAATLLRERNVGSTIIFMTNYPDFVFDSFQVSPFRFLRKPITTVLLHEAMNAYLMKVSRDCPVLLMVDGKSRRLNSNDILYVEANGKYSIVNMKKEQLHCSKTLRQIYELLPSSLFFRVHRSYVVNLDYVTTIRGRNLCLENGDLLYISRDRYKQVVKSYHDFIHNTYVRV